MNEAHVARWTQWLQRLDDSPYRDRFVLRGSLLLDALIPHRRAVADLDFLALGTLPEADHAVRAIAAREPAIELATVQDIWAETDWPGKRYVLGKDRWQLDIGVGDPLVVAPQRRTVLGASALCCAPEILYAWKVHGLFERGEGRWRAKDLWDVYLLQTHLTLDPALSARALHTAFASRATPLEVMRRFFGEQWGRSYGSLRKWSKFRAAAHAAARAPNSQAADEIGELLPVKREVVQRLQALLGAPS